MANNQSTFTLNLETKGMPAAKKDSQVIRDNLEGAQKAASGIGSATKLGGSPSSRKMASSAPAQPTGSAGASAGVFSGQEVQDYNRAAGVAGKAGGSARDFADQARGLGGLVRLYATFAANTFAATAAFGALSRAMDTTNMVKGLDMLGASSGKNLGQLSKRLVEASDGAISLRDAMEATAKTSAAGMSGQNIERLAKVAKNASLALGVSMPDALNRLSRGVSKLEPELLDELGIFTKIEPAVQAYAREIGKSASQLTDFERRQAFANAVIKEGEEKFAALGEASANPYDKLLASLKNVSQSGLDLVNKVLTPIVNLLANSPTGLALALGGIATLLLRQAIPAIGQVRAGLAKAAEDSLQAAKGKAGEALAARTQLNRLIESKVEASADAQVKAVEDAEKRMLSIQKDSINQRGAVYKLLKKDIVDIEQTDLDAAERRYNRIKNDPSRKEEAAASRQVIDSVKGQITAEKELRDVKEKNRQQIQQDAKSWSVFGIVQQKAADYELKAKKQAIISNAAYNASLVGVGGAIKLMNLELEASGLKLGKVGTAALYARAGLAVLASAAATVISGLNKFLGLIGILTAAFGMLASFASKNGKEMNAFDSAVESANGSVENINRTIDLLKAKGGFAAATIEGITAMSNAFGEAADSAQNLLNTSVRAKDAANGWDKFWDGLFSFFGGGIDKNLAKGLSSQLMASMEILKKSDLGEKYKQTFQSILNVGTLDFETVSAALSQASQATRENFIRALQEARAELGNTASRLESFKSSTEGLVKAYQEFMQTTASSDPLFKVGAALEKFAIESQKLAFGGIRELEAAFIDLAKSPEKIATLGSVFTDQFVKIKDGFLEQTTALKTFEQYIENIDNRIKEIQKPENLKLIQERDGAKLRVSEKDLEELRALGKIRGDLERQLRELPKDKIEAARGLFVQGIEISFAKSAELMKVALGNAAEKARLTIEKARIGVLSGELRAQAENRLALKQVDIQIEAVKINLALIDSQEKLTATIAEANSIATEARVKEKAGATPQELETAKSGRQADVIYKSILDSGLTIDRAIQEFEKATHEGVVPLTRALIQAKLSPLEQRRAQQKATLITLRGERTAQEITGGREIRAGKAEDLEKIRGLNDAINQQESTRLGILQSITGTQSQTLANQQIALDNTLLESKFTGELKVLRDRATEAEAAGYKEEAKKIDEQIQLVLKRQSLERDNKGLQDRLKLLQIELDNLAKQQEISKLYRDQYFNSLAGILELQGAQNQYNQDNLSLSQEYIRQQNYLLELQKLQTQESRAKAEAEAQYQAQVAIANTRKQVVGADVGAINAELARDLIKRDAVIAAAEQETILRTRILELQKKSGDEQDRINRLMDTTKSISEGLSAVFGEFGQKLGGLTETLVNVGTQLEKNAQTEKKLRDDQYAAETAGNYEKVYSLQEDINQQKAKSIKDEVSGNAKILGSAKTLFKEKTATYKILGGIEKALHIARIAMDMKELFTKVFVEKGKTAAAISGEVTQTGVAEAGFFARAGTYVTEIFGKISAQLGVFGPPVAAAIVAAIGLSAFGKSATQPKGFTAEEQQSVQGTSRYYDSSGKMQTRAGGILGDPTAKSDVVDKGIQAIEKHTFENLEFSNEMLDALKAIKKNTEAFTSSLLKAVPGLNITPETIKSGNWLFGKDTTETLDRGFKIVGNVGQIIDRQAQLLQYTNTKTSSSGFLGIFGGGTSYGGDIKAIDDKGGTLAKNVSQIFSSMGTAISKAAKTIFTDINPQMVINAFRAIDLSEQLTVSLMGLKGTEAAEAILSVINSGMDSAITMLFPTLEKFQIVGESMGDTIIRLANDIRIVTNSLELMGFSLPVLDESIGAVTQAMLDRVSVAQARVAAADAANKIPRQEWQTQGEDNGWWNTYYGTAESARELADAQLELKAAQDAVTAASSASTTRNLDLIESLKDALGGEDEFIKKTKFFADNFLTEAERLVPVQRRVTTEIASYASRFPGLSDLMNKAGITTLSTRDDFKKLVLSLQDTSNGLNITTELGQGLFTSLMNLAPAFAEVTQGAEATAKALSAEELRNKVLQQQVTILDLLGRSEDSLAIKRSMELEELSKYPKEQADILIANQKYIYALEDEQRLKDKLIKQRDKEKQAINSTISGLKTSITTLENFRTSLTVGDKSTLTPIEKYQQAEREFLQLQNIATSTATTDTEKAAQAEAINKLPSVGERLLDASRILFASSDRYTQDFNRVLSVVDTATGTLKTQKSNAELQLEALDQSTSFLDTINDNTFTTTQLLQQYLDLQLSNSNAFAAILSNTNTAATTAQSYLNNTTSPLIDTAAQTAGINASNTIANASVASGTANAATTGAVAAATNTGYLALEDNLVAIEEVLRASDYTEDLADLRIQTAGVKEVLTNYFSNEPAYTPIVMEIKQTNIKLEELRIQLQNLRTEQQAQTGEIITSNAQVTNNTTVKVSEAISDISSSVRWGERQAVSSPYTIVR